MNNIIKFKDKETTNIEEAVRDTIRKCNIKEPEIKICEYCGKVILDNDIGSKEIEFTTNSEPKYWCKKCAKFYNAVFNLLVEINKLNGEEMKGVQRSRLDFMIIEIHKLLKRKTPKKYIKKYKNNYNMKG